MKTYQIEELLEFKPDLKEEIENHIKKNFQLIEKPDNVIAENGTVDVYVFRKKRFSNKYKTIHWFNFSTYNTLSENKTGAWKQLAEAYVYYNTDYPLDFKYFWKPILTTDY